MSALVSRAGLVCNPKRGNYPALDPTNRTQPYSLVGLVALDGGSSVDVRDVRSDTGRTTHIVERELSDTGVQLEEQREGLAYDVSGDRRMGNGLDAVDAEVMTTCPDHVNSRETERGPRAGDRSRKHSPMPPAAPRTTALWSTRADEAKPRTSDEVWRKERAANISTFLRWLVACAGRGLRRRAAAEQAARMSKPQEMRDPKPAQTQETHKRR